MKSELSFLLELFLSEEVPPPIKKLVKNRIREVECALTVPTLKPIQVVQREVSTNPVIAAQSPSMQKIMLAHPEVPVTLAQPVTPAAAAALQQRAAIIQSGMKEKPEPGRTSPRKF